MVHITDGTHHTSITTNILSIFPTMAPTLTFWQNRNWCQVSVAEDDSLLPVGICCNHQPAAA
jgi:hypothetical protein